MNQLLIGDCLEFTGQKKYTQTTKLKLGMSKIANKIVDFDGLFVIEIIKIKLNGIIERG